MLRKLFIFIILLAYPGISTATKYYVDLDAGSSGDGSYGSPWNSITDVSPSAGNKYYFKCGTSESTSATYTISATGPERQ